MLVRNEKLRSQIIIHDCFTINYCHGSYASKYQVFGNFVGESSHVYEKNIGRSKSGFFSKGGGIFFQKTDLFLLFLGLDTP